MTQDEFRTIEELIAQHLGHIAQLTAHINEVKRVIALVDAVLKESAKE